MPTTESTQPVTEFSKPMTSPHRDILIIIDGENVPHRHHLEDVLNLGRSKTNDVVLEDEAISRKHMKIVREGNKYFVVDHNSTNGVFIEGKRVHANVNVEWAAKEILRAGPFYLSWQPETVTNYTKPALVIGAVAAETRPSRREPNDVVVPTEQLIENPSDAELEAAVKEMQMAEEIDLMAEAQVDAEFARFLEEEKWQSVEPPTADADLRDELYPDSSELEEMEKLVQADAVAALPEAPEMPSMAEAEEVVNEAAAAMDAVEEAAEEVAEMQVAEMPAVEPVAESSAFSAESIINNETQPVADAPAVAEPEPVAPEAPLPTSEFLKQLGDDTQDTEDESNDTAPSLEAPEVAPQLTPEEPYDRTELAFPDEAIQQDRLEMEKSLGGTETVEPFDESHPDRTELAFPDEAIEQDRLDIEKSIDPMSDLHPERTEVAFGDMAIDRDRIEMERNLPPSTPIVAEGSERTEIAFVERDDMAMAGMAAGIAEPTQVAMVSPEQMSGQRALESDNSVLALQPGILILEPGQRAEVEISIVNPTNKTEEYSLHIEDMPRTWFTLSRDSIELRPQERGSVSIVLSVPDIGARAGIYNYSVYAEAMSNPLEIVRVAGELEVKSHHDFEFNVARSAKRDGAVFYVSIHNKGNENDVYHVDRVDGDNTIDLQARNWDMALPPESKDSLRIVAVPVKRPVMGKARNVPFELQVTSRSGYAQNHVDEVEVTPYLTLGMVIWLLVAVALGFTLVWTFLTYVTQSASVPDAQMMVDMVQHSAEIITKTHFL